MFFRPRYITHARHILKGGRKLLAYRRDILKPEDVETLEARLEKLQDAIAKRNRPAVDEALADTEKQFGRLVPAQSHPGWRENCEVILVAIIIALGVRSYILQPFTIPTGSMQPTLNGIIGHPTTEQPPNPLVRLFHTVVSGRNYINVVSEVDDVLLGMREFNRFRFFTFTELRMGRQRIVVRAPRDTLRAHFGVDGSRPYRAGDIIARGYINTGDHVFVDKISYNFRHPQRGDIFVFKTTGITKIESRLDPAMGSQFYIKRLVGLPGETLRIDPPRILINEELPTHPSILRVISSQDGYKGYSNITSRGDKMPLLGTPQATKRLGQGEYFALGDNSYNSSDSRDWGVVPERNIMGRGLFVYWPFIPHWGFMR